MARQVLPRGVQLEKGKLRFNVSTKKGGRMLVDDFITIHLPAGQRRPTVTGLGPWVEKFRAMLQRGENPRLPAPRPGQSVAGMTVSDLLNRYVAEYVRPRYPPRTDKDTDSIDESYKSRLKALHERIGAQPMSDLCHPTFVREFERAYMAKGLSGRKVSRTGVNRVQEILRAAINWANATPVDPSDPKSAMLMTTNPYGRYGVHLGKTERDEPRRHRRMKKAEETAIMKYASPELRDAIHGAMELLCRLSEMMRIRIRDIDPDECTIDIAATATKSGKFHRIMYPPRGYVAGLVKRRAKLGLSAFLFGNARGNSVLSYRTQFETALLRAHGHEIRYVQKISKTGKRYGERIESLNKALRDIDLNWHDLRHEGACRMLASGLNIRVIQLMLNHSTLAQTQKYLNVTDQEMKAGMTPWFTRQEEAAALALLEEAEAKKLRLVKR